MLRRITCVALSLGLLACTPPAPTSSIVLVGEDVVAQTPRGYCVDMRASDPAAGFAVVAPCATFDATQDAPASFGIATIQIGAAGSGTVRGAETTMRDFLTTDAGAALLSGTGNGDTVSGVSARKSDGRVTVRFTDSSPPGMAGLQSQEWRSFTDVNGRLVTIALRGLATAPLDDSTGTWLLNMIATGVRPAVSAAAE